MHLRHRAHIFELEAKQAVLCRFVINNTFNEFVPANYAAIYHKFPPVSRVKFRKKNLHSEIFFPLL